MPAPQQAPQQEETSGVDLDLDQEEADAPRAAKGAGKTKGQTSKPKAKTSGKKRPAGKKPATKAAPRTRAKRGKRGKRGKKGSEEAPKPTHAITVPGLEKTYQGEEGADLLSAFKANHLNLFWGPWAQAFNCRGVATCGLCKVEVLEGADNLSPPDKREQKRLEGKPPGWRIACHAKIQGPVAIEPFPRRKIEDRVSEEALRRALLPKEERDALLQREAEQRQAEREKDKESKPEKPEKKGLLARLTQKGDKGDKKPKDKSGSNKKSKAKDDKKGKAKKVGLPRKGAKKDKTGKKGAGSKGKSDDATDAPQDDKGSS